MNMRWYDELTEFLDGMVTKQSLFNGCEIETVHVPSLRHKIKELSESSSPSPLKDVIEEMEAKRAQIIKSIPSETSATLLKTIDHFLPKLKQIVEGSESYWKKRCVGFVVWLHSKNGLWFDDEHELWNIPDTGNIDEWREENGFPKDIIRFTTEELYNLYDTLK